MAPKLPPSCHLISFETIGSTNDEAKSLAATGALHGTLIWSKQQTQGRGRRGRAWEAPTGNLYCSYVLRPHTTAFDASQLGYVSALAIYDALIQLGIPKDHVQCKWPNDVLINNKKVSGILMESSGIVGHSIEWLVLGVGINVTNHPENTPYPTTSINTELDKIVSVEETLEAFANSFHHWYELWLENGFQAIRETWLSRAARLNEEIIVKFETSEIKGIFSGIDETGSLLLKQPGKDLKTISVGDIFFPTPEDTNG